MHQAESRALRAIQSKHRQQPYRKPQSTAPRPHTKFLSAPSHSFRSFNFKQLKKPSVLDMRFNCHQYGHWKSACTAPRRQPSSNANAI